MWEDTYQQAWVESVVAELEGDPFDGVMADNDVWDDYHGHGLDMTLVRTGLDRLLQRADPVLEDIGKLLVPNIAESRRDPGRWARMCPPWWSASPPTPCCIDAGQRQRWSVHGPDIVSRT